MKGYNSMQKVRQSNFELLRILCILMIVGHILLSQKLMTAVGTRDFYIDNIYKSFSMKIHKKIC